MMAAGVKLDLADFPAVPAPGSPIFVVELVVGDKARPFDWRSDETLARALAERLIRQGHDARVRRSTHRVTVPEWPPWR